MCARIRQHSDISSDSMIQERLVYRHKQCKECIALKSLRLRQDV